MAFRLPAVFASASILTGAMSRVLAEPQATPMTKWQLELRTQELKAETQTLELSSYQNELTQIRNKRICEQAKCEELEKTRSKVEATKADQINAMDLKAKQIEADKLKAKQLSDESWASMRLRLRQLLYIGTGMAVSAAITKSLSSR